MRRILWVFIPIFLVAVVLVALAQYAKQPSVEYLQGQMDAKRVLVASKVPGRVAALYAKEGDSVTQGALLAQIASPEIEAKKTQAEGALQAATAQFQKAQAGTREEQIAQARAQAKRAGEALDFANATYGRVKKLFEEGVLPQQKHDEALVQMQNAAALKDAADAQLRMALAGAQVQDKEAARGLVVQAGGAKSEVMAYLDETRLVAPLSGEVTLKTVEAGELVGTGMPVFAITDLSDAWAVFNLREDFLPKAQKGTVFRAWVPAIAQSVDFEIYYISPVGDYATWRSSKESGGFDLKTFEVRAKPTEAAQGLRPGMSVLWPLHEAN